MLINTQLFIAFKCDQCDHVQIFGIYAFLLLNRENSVLRCDCRGSYIKIIKINQDRFKLVVYCSKCEKTHIFLLSRRALMNKGLLLLYCPYSRLELCLIGNDKEVIFNKLDEIEKNRETLVDKRLNEKGYFANSKVMFESLRKIKNIIKSGKVICRCGSSNVSVVMLKDKLVLICRECLTKKYIKASNNKDLVRLLEKQNIFLDKE